MDKNILAKNILILDELRRFSELVCGAGMRAVVLKGAALIALEPAYIGTRAMDDIDIFVRGEDMPAVRSIISALGYYPVPGDPWTLKNGKSGIAFDLCAGLWYLSRKENEAAFQGSKRFPLNQIGAGLFHLPPDEFFIHLAAHCAVHHNIKEKKWIEDISLLRALWPKETSTAALAEKLSGYGLWEAAGFMLRDVSGVDKSSGELWNRRRGRRLAGFLLNSGFNKTIPNYGHILRFALLPGTKKIPHLLKALFPSGEFLALRYGLTGASAVTMFRFLRPCIMLFKLLLLPFKKLRAAPAADQ
ncbi:MAG TPA: hypothetical protein DEE98_02745 [Elusimicrobia bacterium]|nr:MAG: hypothetical protein A2278_07575 [Elusimicrobia bacterium RIFOXYA12_FULL_49_49]OGS11121.1 MAG: hypothetical protein A2386_05870 [Elusimicrobia bacterium RIFOXYB1_FULL_48_9]OGS16074.1 MAG: hypothetical protein A2251_02690 [Elusimicrobia bacterium RIFOXYA2_FULL_47_53]OGS26700.1 MAG: hypothetical protein A2339_03740 [Elusimicrobia bacterium RIFOXYB12_FULL_50_12]OGS30174.1 MAG: hypothetical protein A2323_01845 [Elusimicrobia bacterium RIFOXYB2_FULL_46_23]HBU69283.1 hypothetical protein [El